MTTDAETSSPAAQGTPNAQPTAGGTGTASAAPAPGADDAGAGDRPGMLGSVEGDDSAPQGEDKTGKQADSGKPGQSDDVADLEIELPEGIELDEKLFEGFKKLAPDVGLDKEGASKLATWFAGQQAEAQKATDRALADLRADWDSEIQNDEEFGGSRLKATNKAVTAALRRFGGDLDGDKANPLTKELVRLGMDRNPELIRFCARIGKAIEEDTSDVGGAGRGPGELTQQQYLDRFYGNTPNKKPGG